LCQPFSFLRASEAASEAARQAQTTCGCQPFSFLRARFVRRYDYLIGAGGYAEEWSLPYISYFGTTNGTCPDSPSLKAGISDYVKIEENNAADVMEALATVGPLAINVDASNWHTYESGIFDSCSYESMDLDHVVVLVGYGTDEELGDYWLVRNSWSPT
jgi:hypothetical protein